MRLLVFLLIATALAKPGFSAVGPERLDQWALRHESQPLLPAMPGFLQGIAFGNQLYVAVGGGGTIVTTSDPGSVRWSIQKSGTSNSLFAVTFANDRFVAVGLGGTIVTSIDGTHWVQQSSGTSALLRKVAYGGGIFVTVGFDTILTSPDGVTWTRRPINSPELLSRGFEGIRYGNGVFVVVGFNAILTSPDGVTWMVRKCPSSTPLVSVAYGNGLYAAVSATGVIVTSPDAVDWKQSSVQLPSAILYDVVYFNGDFVVVGGSVSDFSAKSIVISSKDGEAWTPRFSPSASLLLSVAVGNGQLVAIGGGLVGPVPLPNAVQTSADGITWRETGVPPTLRGAVFGSDAFVVVGSNGIVLKSADGAWWETFDSGAGTQLNDITFNGRTYVAVGNQGTILTSENGTAWTQRRSGVDLNLNGVAFGNGLFAVVGGEQVMAIDGTLATAPRVILTSDDGVEWTSRENQTIPMALYDVCFGNGRFIAVGGGKPRVQQASWVTAISENAWAWQGKFETFRDFITGTAYGNRLFVAVGSTDSIFTSPDAKAWTRSRPSVAPLYGLTGVSFGGGIFSAVGPQGTLYTSTNGTAWTKRNVGITRDLNATAYGKGTLVAVGDSGVILQSGQWEAPNTPLLLRPAFVNGAFSISFQTVANKRYTLEFKRSLSEPSWQSSSVVIGDGELTTATDAAAGEGERFYRLRVE